MQRSTKNLCIVIGILNLSLLRLSAQTTDLSKYQHYFDGELKKWTITFTNFNLKDFSKPDIRPFDHEIKKDFSDLKHFLSIYKPIITFSPDSNQFIDLYSYELNLERKGNKIYAMPEDHQTVVWCNIKNKEWVQILFQWIDEVIWISNSNFMLVATEEQENSSYLPVIYIGDTKKKSFDIFHSKNKNCVQKKGMRYGSSKPRKIKIYDL